MRSGPHIVLHLLQHHTPIVKRGPAGRHLHPFPNRRQPLQPSASPRTHGTIEELITELLFADDCTLLTHTEEASQHIVNRFSDAAKNFGITISLKKTEVLYQPPPRVAYSPHISIDGTNLNAVEHFTYLGSVISNDATVSKNLDNRLQVVPLKDCQRE